MNAPLVIFADDHLEMRRLMALVLGKHGFAVALAADGRALVDLARRHPEAVAVVTDVRMPGRSGLDALATLAADGANPPDALRIVVTAFGDEATHAAARSLGATCIDKPFDPDDLVARIQAHLDGEAT